MTTPPLRPSSLTERLIRALILDRAFYEQIAADATALSQAIGVVILAGIVNGLTLTHVEGAIGAVIGIVVSVVSWLILSAIVFAVGAALPRGGPASFRSVASCLGFANVPALANLLSVLPGVGLAVRGLVWFWLLAATIVATRAAFGVSLGRGALIGGLGFAVYMLIGVLLGLWSS